jgi:hypothetical protein
LLHELSGTAVRRPQQQCARKWQRPNPDTQILSDGCSLNGDVSEPDNNFSGDNFATKE